jgi:hypothetical protein
MAYNTERELIGNSPSFGAALNDIDIAANADCTVLLQGRARSCSHKRSTKRARDGRDRSSK